MGEHYKIPITSCFKRFMYYTIRNCKYRCIFSKAEINRIPVSFIMIRVPHCSCTRTTTAR